MRRFINLDRLDTRFIDGREVLLLTPEFGFVTRAGREIIIRTVTPSNGIREGFLTDGGSIPRFAWPIVGHPFGRYLPAFLIHDYDFSFRAVGFDEANETLHETLDTLHCPRWQRLAIVNAVHLCGHGIWARGAVNNGSYIYHYGEIAA